MLFRIPHAAAATGKAAASYVNLLAALMVACPAFAADQPVLSGDPPNAPAILSALAAQFPARKFSRAGPFCRGHPLRIVHDSGGDWAAVVFFDRSVCFERSPNDIPYEVWLKRSPAGAWSIVCQSRYSDVPPYDQVLKVCSAMPKAVYDAFFGS